jgi:hypothetical protein
MHPDFAAESGSSMMDLAKKYGVTLGGRIVKVPPPPAPVVAGAECHRRANPSPLEAALLDTTSRRSP